MVTVLGVLGVLVVLLGAALVATREGPVLADAPPDRADLGLPAGSIGPADVERVRFGLALRGYRMAEVDEVLDRLAAELHARDERIAVLLAALDGGASRRPVSTAEDHSGVDGRVAGG